MKLAQLEKLVVDALEDIKGRDIEVINTTKLTSLFDAIVVACGDSNRQVRSLARNVQDKAREAGVHVLSCEGEESGRMGPGRPRRHRRPCHAAGDSQLLPA
jgi:ribosome-associated protein